jgi:Gpi18-like mannosyltransferase
MNFGKESMRPATAAYGLGIVCALALYCIFAAALAVAVGPYIRRRDSDFAIVLALLVAIAFVKLALLHLLPGQVDDLAQFELWAKAMAARGPGHIYEPEYKCIYTPGYFYALWPAGLLMPKDDDWPRIAIEFLTISADFFYGLAVYAAARRLVDRRLAIPTVLLVALNPMMIFTSTGWGQNDSAIAFPVLLSLVMAFESRYDMAWAIAIVGALIKAQGVIFLPVLGWLTLVNGDRKRWIKSAVGAVATGLVVFAPFQIGRPWHFLIDVYWTSLDLFSWPSVNAFNLMFILEGRTTVSDTDPFIGSVSYSLIGRTLFVLTLATACWMMVRDRRPTIALFATFLTYFGMFLFLPRMHERYLYYAVAALAPLALASRTTLSLYIMLSITSLLDLASVSFRTVQIHGLITDRLLLGFEAKEIISIINVAAFCFAVWYGTRTGLRSLADSSGAPTLEMERGGSMAV